VRLSNDKLAGWEALVRWHHPTRGLVSPALFIPVAEETGLIVALGHWVLKTACQQAYAWQALADNAALIMSVNVAARQFQSPGLVEDVAEIVRQTGIPPHSLKIEITESAVMHDAVGAIRTLHALKALGIQLAIDDFGTGYSSLAYLKRFPVDTLKVDQSFVGGLGRDTQDAAIVQTVIGLASALDLNVTAEGIETAAQRAQLTMLGCGFGQGYLFGRPMTADTAELQLMARSRPAA
jgi:EAL domain-containing protein (putative c-di-GMP-specific phosphodiesterase class I)